VLIEHFKLAALIDVLCVYKEHKKEEELDQITLSLEEKKFRKKDQFHEEHRKLAFRV